MQSQRTCKKYGVSVASVAAVATRWVLCKGANSIVGVNIVERVDEFLESSSLLLIMNPS